jgi:ribosomal protein S18 acetylase RimI-like enzyme
MDIIEASISDAQEILSLQKLCYLSEAEIYNDYKIPPLTQSLEEIKNEFENYKFFKVIDGSRIVGSVRAAVNGDICTIYKLIVHPEYQNKGIGSSLINKVEESFENKRFEIFTGHKSEKNIYLYQKMGYMIFKKEKLTDDIDMVYLAK